MRSGLGALALVVGLSSAARGDVAQGSGVAQTQPAVQRFTLGNGMRVVVAPDLATERLWLVVRYDVGARDDPAGHHGMAHLTEHLSFRHGDVLVAYDDLGAQHVNGVTGADETVYYARVAKGALERALWIESRRMAFMLDGIDARALSHEQKIVTQEWRENVHSGLGDRWSQPAEALLFPEDHPYHRLGDVVADVAAIELSEVQWFAQEHYGPAHATLVLTGPLEADEARRLVERYFGAVAGHPPQRARGATQPAVGPMTRSCRLSVGSRLSDEVLGVHWVAPPRDSQEAAQLQVVLALLDARLTRRLVDADGPASSVSIAIEDRELASALKLHVIGRGDEPARALLQLVDAELAALHRGGFTAAELADARAYVARRRERESPLERALRLARTDREDDLEEGTRLDTRMDTASVQRIARRWLDARRRVVVTSDRRNRRDSVHCEEVAP